MGIDANQLLVQLRKANIQPIGGGPLYATSKIDLDAAMQALNIVPTDPIAEAPPEAKLAIDAHEAAKDTPRPQAKAYQGNENEETPQFILEGAYADDYRDFPNIPNPDPDKVYRPIHTSSDRQYRMILKGYKFVMDPAHIARIGNGTLERFINSKNRVQYKDRELAFLPIALAMEHRRRRREAWVKNIEATKDTFPANVEAAKRKLGRGADAKLEAFEMPEGEAMERRDHALAASEGIQRVSIDLGAVKKKIAEE